MKDKVSIIIPVYNIKVDIFEKCISSVVNQSYSYLDIIVINDGSDSMLTKQYQCIVDMDSRIRMYTQNNLGVSAARNRGIRNAEEYIMFCDADDYLPSNCVESLMVWEEEYVADLIFGNVSIEKSVNKRFLNEEKSDRIWDEKPKELLLDILNRFVKREYESIDFCVGKIYKKSIIRNHQLYFQEDIKQGEDRLFNFQYLNYCQNAKYINDIVYNYVINEKSTTQNFYEKHVENTCLLMEKYELLVQDMQEIYIKAFERRCVWSIIFLLQKFYLNDANQNGFIENYKLFKNLIKSRIYKEALQNISLSEIPFKKARLEVFLIKNSNFPH